MPPLVSCIMPTANRRRFVECAIAQFFRQTYENKQLVIVEDGEEDCSDLTGSLYRSSEAEVQQIVYRHLGPQRHSIGAKRNVACALAQGELIAHWDDDDWNARNRLATQLASLSEKEDAQLCGLSRLVFYRPDSDEAWLYQSLRDPWLAGASLVYSKALWRKCGGFTDVSNGEDVAFLDRAVEVGAGIVKIEDESLYVAVLHGANTVPRTMDPYQWSSYPTAAVRSWMERCK